MKIDRRTVEIIRQEYVRSLASVRELAEKYNVKPRTLLSRASYSKWSAQREAWQAKEHHEEREVFTALTREAFKDRAQQFVNRIKQECEQSLTRIEQLDRDKLITVDGKPAYDYADLSEREQLVSSLQRRGWTAFGLDAPTGTTNVMVHLQAEVAHKAPAQLTDSNQVIDVESVGECAGDLKGGNVDLVKPKSETKQDTSTPETSK